MDYFPAHLPLPPSSTVVQLEHSIILDQPVMQARIEIEFQGDAGEVKHGDIHAVEVQQLVPTTQVEPPLTQLSANMQLVKSIANLLIACGMGEHFSNRGEDVHRHTCRLAALVQWFYFGKFQKQIVPVEEEVMNVLTDFLNKDYNQLQSFCEFLRTERKFSPQTCCNYIRDVFRGFEWLCLLAPVHIREPMSQMAGVDNMIKKVCAGSAPSPRPSTRWCSCGGCLQVVSLSSSLQ